MNKRILLGVALLAVALVAAGPLMAQGQSDLNHGNDLPPNGKGNVPQGQAKAPAGGGGGNGIFYHGGPVMTGGPNVYLIWYGDWSSANPADPTAPNVITTFLNNEGGSPYFNINTTYYNGSNMHVANRVSVNGSANDAYSRGTALGDADIQAIVASAINGGKLPSDTNGVYFVLTSKDVNETTGFCTQYCGWHTHGTINGADIKYSFVGDSLRCPSACQQQAVGPNGSGGGDGMASIVAHELEEATTDPDLNAWYDRRGQENADKCAWTFGTTSTASNGAAYNMTLGGLNFLIQRNWVNASGGFCSMSF